jgi:hypothetical protein
VSSSITGSEANFSGVRRIDAVRAIPRSLARRPIADHRRRGKALRIFFLDALGI